MNIKPVCFTTPMVRAILQGQKTTFRLPVAGYTKGTFNFNPDTGLFTYVRVDNKSTLVVGIYKSIPHHMPGDILRVQETWTKHNGSYYYKASIDPALLPYLESEEESWHSPTTMPKEASRIFLRVKGVYTESLQELTEEDAKLEGAEFLKGQEHQTLVDRYRDELWDNYWKPRGKHTWKSNPWVWAYEFERIDKPEGWGIGTMKGAKEVEEWV